MARKSDNIIPVGRTDIDWGRDSSNGLPYSGQSVQKFIKDMLNSKASTGAFDRDNMILYLFKDELDKAAFEDDPLANKYLAVGTIPFNFGTTQNRIKITPDGNNTTINASLNQQTIMLGMEFRAETKEISDPTWTATGKDVQVRVYLDASSTGTFTEITQLRQKALSSDGRVDLDLKPYIPTGTSRVRVYFFVDDDESISASIPYTVTLAEMYIEAWENNLMWNRALIEDDQTDNYSLGGFRIVGNIAKTLHVTFSTANTVVASFAYDMGITEAIERGFFFTRAHGFDLSAPKDAEGNSLQALTTGIYSVRVWITSGNLTTEDSAVTYNVMYVASGEQYSAKLVVMNNSGEEVNNYDEMAHLCDYAIYNAGSSYGDVTIDITTFESSSPNPTVTTQTTVETSTIKNLYYNINLNTSSDSLSIDYKITLSNGNWQKDSSRVDNKEIFPAEGGVSFYLNPSLRSNGDPDKTVVYNTARSSSTALQSVTWDKMSWVDGMDGWTIDENGRKCLMLPARSKLTIPVSSYQFLRGNNVTFELCYRVSNVSDYSENIITIAQYPTEDSFTGIRIKPTNITLHSDSDNTSGNDKYQGTNVADEETIHLLISIQTGFQGHDDKNLVAGYINGTKAFEFEHRPCCRTGSECLRSQGHCCLRPGPTHTRRPRTTALRGSSGPWPGPCGAAARNG